MAIRMTDSPGADVLRSALAPIVARRERAATRRTVRSGGVQPSRALDIAGPHRVFSLGMDDVAGGGMLDRAQPIGFRFFVLDGDRAVAMAQASADGARFSSVTFGFLGEAMLRAIAVAETLPEVAQNEVELRVIEVPGVCLIALWLVGDRTALLIPLDPAPEPVQADRPYTVDQFEDAVAGAVERETGGGGTRT